MAATTCTYVGLASSPCVSKPGALAREPGHASACASPIASLITTLKHHKGIFVDRQYANVVLAPMVLRLDATDQELQRLLVKFGWCAREGFQRPLDLRGLQATLQKHLYVRYQVIGTGAYGEVQRAFNRETMELQAIKKIKMSERGLCEATIREISTLRELNHCNIVKLREVIAMVPSKYCYLVLELLERDLHSFLYDSRGPRGTDLRTTKSIMFQVLSGLHHAHSNSIIHRDLKPQNILLGAAPRPDPMPPPPSLPRAQPPIFACVSGPGGFGPSADGTATAFAPPPAFSPPTPPGAAAPEQFGMPAGGAPASPSRLVVKIADFGLARSYLPASGAVDPRDGAYTDWVVTLYYRAPELLLGSRRYGPGVDIWSAGCVAAELLAGQPLFVAQNETGLLKDIFAKLGAPPASLGQELPEYGALALGAAPGQGLGLERLIPRLSADPVGADLLSRMLSYDYRQRISASAALQHPWFDEVRAEELAAQTAAAQAPAAAAAAGAAAGAAAAAGTVRARAIAADIFRSA